MIKTENTHLILRNFCGYLEQVYYGAGIHDYKLDYLRNNQILNFSSYDPRIGLSYIYSAGLYEYSGENTGDYRISALNIITDEGFIGCRLCYKGYEILYSLPEKYNLPTIRAVSEILKIVLTDKEKKIDVALYYFVVDDCDAICRFAEIINCSDKSIFLTNAVSLQLDFDNRNFDLISYCGISGGELSLQRQKILKGRYEISSNYGMTSHAVNPSFTLCDPGTNETTGECYGFNLLYSGNFKNCIEFDEHNMLRVTSGINDRNFRWKLMPGESFFTPQAVMIYSENGFGNLSRCFHRLIRQHILPPQFRCKYPIVVNTWESYHFSVTAQKTNELAEKAAEIGADTVVLDDGWFRNDDKHGLGDWTPLADKFPNGLDDCIAKVRGEGLSFGLWFEPEMVNKNSRLYKAHPDWILNNGDMGSESRNQYVLDMTNPDVRKYLLDVLFSYLEKYPISYIKWDANRYLSEVGSRFQHNQGEVWHRYVLGVYEILSTVSERFPDVFIEGCAGGGGRFDLGMLYFQPSIWLSDNTDPYGRARMHYDATFAYPPCVLSYHISADNGVSGKISDPDFRFLVSELGGFGYEFDLTALTADEVEQYRFLTERRKKIEKYIFNGDFYRLDVDNRFYYACLQVLPDLSGALFTFLQLDSQINYESVRIRLPGLKADTIYEAEGSELRLYGRTLEKAGIRVSDLLCPHWPDRKKTGIGLSKGKSGSGISVIFREYHENRKE